MEKETQIKDTTIFLMIFTAICFDGAQAVIGWIPIVGNIVADIVTVFALMTFLFWFMMVDIKISPKRLMALASGGVVEMIPFLNILPAWTGVVIYIIGTTRIKELANKHPTMAKGAMSVGTRIKGLDKKRDSSNMSPNKNTQLEDVGMAT